MLSIVLCQSLLSGHHLVISCEDQKAPSGSSSLEISVFIHASFTFTSLTQLDNKGAEDLGSYFFILQNS